VTKKQVIRDVEKLSIDVKEWCSTFNTFHPLRYSSWFPSFFNTVNELTSEFTEHELSEIEKILLDSFYEHKKVYDSIIEGATNCYWNSTREHKKYKKSISYFFLNENSKKLKDESFESDRKMIASIHSHFINNSEQNKHFPSYIEYHIDRLKKEVRDKTREIELIDIEEKEAARFRGQAKGLESFYKMQFDLMMKLKEHGANIDKEIFEMEKELLSLENQENTAMIDNLINTVRGLKQ
jgi:hypothetical protein